MKIASAETPKMVHHICEFRTQMKKVAMTHEIPSALEILEHYLTVGSVCDIGCYGWKLAALCERQGRALVGVDHIEPLHIPAIASFKKSTAAGITMQSDSVDVTIATHVIEHVANPTTFFAELVRVTRPGGFLFLEAPSEESAMIRGSDTPQDQSFGSFWDDPTHIRPWPPGAMYRLALGAKTLPIAIARAMAGSIPVVRMLAFKPSELLFVPETRYVSLEGCEPGVDAGWRHVWQEPAPALTEQAKTLINQLMLAAVSSKR